MWIKVFKEEKNIIMGLLMMAKRGAVLSEDKENTKLADKLINKFNNKAEKVNIKGRHLDIINLMVEDALVDAAAETEGMRNLGEEDEKTLKEYLLRFDE